MQDVLNRLLDQHPSYENLEGSITSRRRYLVKQGALSVACPARTFYLDLAFDTDCIRFGRLCPSRHHTKNHLECAPLLKGGAI